MGMSDSLPPGWTTKIHPKANRRCWIHEDGTVVWVRPKPEALSAGGIPAAQTASAAAHSRTVASGDVVELVRGLCGRRGARRRCCSGTCLCVDTSQCIPLCSRAQVLDVVVALRRSIVEALLRRVVVVRRASEHGSRQHSSSDGASLKRH